MSSGSAHLLAFEPEAQSWGSGLVSERRLLGAMLRDEGVYPQVREIVAPEDFSSGLHERLFEAFDRIPPMIAARDVSSFAGALGHYAWDAEGGVPAYFTRLLAEAAPSHQAVTIAQAIHARAHARRHSPEPIEVDVLAWSQDQAALLARLAERTDALSQQVDWQSLIEEILFVGRSQTSGVVRELELIFEHLLKALSDPDAPSRNRWRIEIVAWQRRIARDLAPSMRRVIDLDGAWARGRSEAEVGLIDYGVRLAPGVPHTCPFRFDDLVSDEATMRDLLELLVTRMAENATAQQRGES